MDNYLDIDLNDIVSKQIKEQIESLEERLSASNKENQEYYNQLCKANEKLKAVANLDFLLSALVRSFNSLKADPDSTGGIQEVRYNFIKKVLKDFFNVDEQRYYHGDSLQVGLCVNYYSEKETVIGLVEIIIPESQMLCNKIRGFKLPIDYSKEQILSFVKMPHTCTNGCYLGASSYWSGDASGAPYDQFFKSDFILDTDVFEHLVKSALSHPTLYRITDYRQLSKDQIQMLSKTLINVNPRYLREGDIKSFIVNNITEIHPDVLDYCYKSVSNNKYDTFFYGTFPIEYQKKFLDSLSFDKCFDELRNLKWANEDKEAYLFQRLNNQK